MICYLSYLLVALPIYTSTQSYYSPSAMILPYYPAPAEKLIFIFNEAFMLSLGSSADDNLYGSIPFRAVFQEQQVNIECDNSENEYETCSTSELPYKPDTWQPNNIGSAWLENGLFYFTMNNVSGNYTLTCDTSRIYYGIKKIYLNYIGSTLPRRMFSCSKN